MHEYDPLGMFVLRLPGKVTLLQCERCDKTRTFGDTVRLSDIVNWATAHAALSARWHGPENMNGES